LARLIFSGVPTASGGVASGNISTGAGSPFGSGGKYEAQVADIKATIAKAPKGYYDPKDWDQFLELDPEQIPQGLRFIPSDDPEITNALLNIPTARDALIGLSQMNLGSGGRTLEACHRCSPQQHVALAKQRDQYYSTIALNVNQLMMKKNAPLIQAIEEQQRQKEIDQAVQLALEQKIRETATLTPTAPAITSSISLDKSWSNYAILGIGVVIFLIILRRRA